MDAGLLVSLSLILPAALLAQVTESPVASTFEDVSSCAYSLSRSSHAVGPEGGAITALLSTGKNCPWTIVNGDPQAITVTSASSGAGDASLNLIVGPNLRPNPRNLTLLIGSSRLSIMQPSAFVLLSQSITFDAIPNQIFGVSPFEIAAEATSELPVIFTSNTPAVCQTASGLVTLLSLGTCSITANQNGNGTYVAATPAMRSFTVGQAKPGGAFRSPSSGGYYFIGAYPAVIALGDFNRDGIPDLIMANTNGSIDVFLGNGSGGFALAPSSPIALGGSFSFSSVAVGDFNGDGIPDLALANSAGNAVLIVLGNGSAGFTEAGAPITVGTQPRSLAVGDFNGDGIEDLAVANETSSTVTILLGNGSGGFSEAANSPYTTGTGPQFVAVGDFNRDGIQDLATANATAGTVTLLLGNGSGGFNQATSSPFVVGTYPRSMVAGDFNGDGIQDLAVANYVDDNVTVLLGNGSGGFTAAPGSPFAAGQQPQSLVAADFNGDGIPDLATVDINGNNVTILQGNGSGGFTTTTNSPFAVGAVPNSIVAGDFNGDGIEDLAVANGASYSVSVFQGYGAPAVVSVTPSSGSGFSQTFAVTVADSSGTSYLGYVYFIVSSSLATANSCFVEFNKAANTIRLANDGGTGWSAVAVAGTGAPLSNSQCTVNPAAFTIITVGNNLTVNLALTFAAAYGGTKNLYVQAYDVNHESSDWGNEGTWTVPVPGPPSVISVNPSSGTGGSQTFEVTVADSNGAANVGLVYLVVNPTLSGVNSCYVEYNQTTSAVRLANDGGAAWSASSVLGSGAALSNTRCTVSAAASSTSAAGNNLKVRFAMSFANLPGSDNLYVQAYDVVGQTSGWQTEGTWTIPPPGPPTVASVSPSSGNGSSQVFSVTVADAYGGPNIGSVYVVVSSSLTGTNSCYIQYTQTSQFNHPTNTLQLANDAGTAWSASSIVGSGAAVSNSQCMLYPAYSSSSATGNNLTINFAVSFAESYGGAKNVYIQVYDSEFQTSGWQNEATWTVPILAPPSIVSITPASGSGGSQTFAVTVSDNGGVSNIGSLYLLVSSSLAQTNACYVEFNEATNSVQLANDGATAWSTPVLAGSGTAISNSQCTVNPASFSRSVAGNNLTIGFALSFAAGYAGAKALYVQAVDLTGLSAGWQLGGTWTVPGAGSPSVVSVTPGSGSGGSQTFAITVADAGGSASLAYVYLVVSSSLTGANSCYVQYNQGANTIQLANDAGTAWSSASVLGSGAALSNSQCTLTATLSSRSLTSNTLTLNLAASFAVTYGGAKNVYVQAYDLAQQSSGWQAVGTWTVPGVAPPSVVSVAPASGSGGSQVFSITITDNGGAANVNFVYLVVSSSLSGVGSCYVQFNRVANTIQLANDAGGAWSSTSAVGTGSSLSNSQCTLNAASSSISLAGNTLTLSLPVSFAASYAGAKNVYVQAYDGVGQSTGWQTAGSWTVPLVGPPAVVSLTPTSGSGGTQTFTVTVSDSGGASNIGLIYLNLNTTLNVGNSCYIEYNQATNAIRLANDYGTAWSASIPVGTGGTVLSNARCTLTPAAFTVGASGNNLTVGFPLSFSNYPQTDNVYVQAYDLEGQTSGWQQEGTWTLPNPGPPTVVSVSPSSGTGASQTFAVTVTDIYGGANIGYVYLVVSPSLTGTNSCYLQYNQLANTIQLANDAGTSWSSASVLGSGSALSNSQCALTAASSSRSTTANNLTIDLAVSFSAGYTGAKNAYVEVYDIVGQSSGWQTEGTWTVP